MKKVILFFILLFLLLVSCKLDEDITTTPINFYYLCSELDPFFNLLPEAYLYITEEIPNKDLHTNFINLMYEHTSIKIENWWVENNKLYVDLHPLEVTFFNQGSTGSTNRGNRLTKTLASMPNIHAFEVFVGGIRGYETDHYNFAWVAWVEEGEVVAFVGFDNNE